METLTDLFSLSWLLLSMKGFWQGEDEITNLVTHPSVMDQGLIFGEGIGRHFGRVVKSSMDFFAWKKWAGFIGMAAEGNDEIELPQR